MKDAGESPLFPPKYKEAEEAKAAILDLVRREPATINFGKSRWSLDMIIENLDWLQVKTRSGVSQLLERLGISYKRGREYVHSPDRNYRAKLDLLEIARLRSMYAQGRYIFLYEDEVTFYLQPTVARAYEEQGRMQALARRSHTTDSSARIVAAMNALTGQTIYRQQNKITVPCLVNFWYDVRKSYPEAETIYIAVDNWPVHFHPDVLAPLQAQNFPWPPKLPPNWPIKPSAGAKHDDLPIQLICLPTYASWLNPIEKLWRWLRHDVLHLHRLSNDWSGLRQCVVDFMDRFKFDSPSLLRYTGLLPG